jgi:hypothetical protein
MLGPETIRAMIAILYTGEEGIRQYGIVTMFAQEIFIIHLRIDPPSGEIPAKFVR